MGFEFLLVNYTDSVEIKEGEETKGEQEAAKVTSLSPRDSSLGISCQDFCISSYLVLYVFGCFLPFEQP